MAQIFKNPGTVFGDLTFDGDEFFTGVIELGGLAEHSVIMGQNAADPAAEALKGKVYTKDVAGATELFYLDAAGNVVQITNAGGVFPGWATLDDVPDGVTYQRVKASTLISGLVKQIVDPVTGFNLIPSIVGAHRTLTLSASVALNQNLRTTDGVAFDGVISTDLISLGSIGSPVAVTSGSNGITSVVSDSTGAGAETAGGYFSAIGTGAGGAQIIGNISISGANNGCTSSYVFGNYASSVQAAGSIISYDLIGSLGKISLNAVVLGNTPSRYVAGVAGEYATPGIDPQASFASSGGKAAVLGYIKDGLLNTPMSVFLAVLEGNSVPDAVKVHSAFKAINYRTTAGIGYDYGLDLYNEAGIGTTIITSDLRLSNGNLISNLVSGIVVVNCEITPTDLRMLEMATPASEANYGKVYTKDFGGATELCYLDAAGNEVQITNAGNIDIGTLTLDDIPNGVTYGRVLLTSLTNGEVTKLTDAIGDDLTVSLGGANRVLTLGANISLDQNLEIVDSPTFNALTLSTTLFASDGSFSNDVIIGRDLTITRNCQIGGGYGSTGWTCDVAGNTYQDGDFVSLGDLSAVSGSFSSDVLISRDLTVTRNCQIGGGYGATGWTCDVAGNTQQDGFALFSVGIASGNTYYLGDMTTNGSWRIIISGTDLSIERLEAAVWVPKSTVLA